MPSLDLVDGLRPLNEGDLRDSFATDVVEIGRDHLLW
jgi:hypothetical protein